MVGIEKYLKGVFLGISCLVGLRKKQMFMMLRD